MDNDTLLEATNTFCHPGNERFVLSCLLADSSRFYDVSTDLFSGRGFLDLVHRNIYLVISSLVSRGVKNLDTVTIFNEAHELGLDVSSMDYVHSIVNTYASQDELPFYLNKIKEAYLKYKSYLTLLEKVEEIKANNRTGEQFKTASDLISSTTESIIDISLTAEIQADPVDMGSFAVDYIRSIAEAKKEVLGLTTGFSLLDKRLNGLRPGTMTSLAARPKIGKTMFLMNVAKHVAFVERKPVLYIDTEMTEEEQASRLVSMLSGVPERMILKGQHLTREDWNKNVEDAFTLMQTGKLLFKYMPGYKVDLIKGLARKYKLKDDIGLLIFDYIKLPGLGDLDMANETQFMGQVTTALKDLAGELRIPVLVACQLGRVAEGKSRVTSGMIGETDRILRYVSSQLALCRKTMDEIKEQGDSYGKYRLQILDTRGGGELYEGIDIDINKPTLLVREAPAQSLDLWRLEQMEEEHKL